MSMRDRIKLKNDLRVIKTARDFDSINAAAKKGFRPLIKKLEPSDEIRVKYSVLQNKETGEIRVIGDYRSGPYIDDDGVFVRVIDWSFYYPYRFDTPYAAYLIPKDIQIGERVLLEDLIDDYIESSWNQGDNYRLGSCEAIWNGTDFEIQYNPGSNRRFFIG